ncbi:class I SAM-dependent methyltransferase [Candidatus Pelagibacter bacterium]|jgi:SAM-dependent methyltransferase|nr:class I SAM-dependent methyltransferase [Candidatus Pelagibacter bacterium]
MLHLIKNYIINFDQKFLSARLYKVYSSFVNLGKPNIKFNHQLEIKYEYQQENTLGKLFEKYGSDKGYVDLKTKTLFGWKAHSYSFFYSFLFQDKVLDVKKILECGIGTNNPKLKSNMTENGKPGASLRVWREYFKYATVYGADVDKEILFQDERIKTFYVNQLDPKSVENMWEGINENDFDIIIDDGLHTFDAAISLFQNSIQFLKTGGLYVIEDVKLSFLEKLAHELKSYNPHVIKFNDMGNVKYDNNLIYIKK